VSLAGKPGLCDASEGQSSFVSEEWRCRDDQSTEREGAQAKPYQVKQVRAVILKAKLDDEE
jgi:hypothetical protein